MSCTFSANATSGLLSFENTSVSNGSQGSALDNVRIVGTAPVPLPGSGVLLLGAIGGVAFARRRSQRK